MESKVNIKLKDALLSGHLIRPAYLKAWVIFVHGSGSSQFSPRNNYVAKLLSQQGYGTLLFDLLTQDEDLLQENRFNIQLLSKRLQAVTDWFLSSDYFHDEPIAFFGASTGAAAALVAASEGKTAHTVFTVISRGGRPDLAGRNHLLKVSIPVLLIVGSFDQEVIYLNQLAEDNLMDSKLVLIPGATHLFEEPGTLDKVIEESLIWLDQHLPAAEHEQLDANSI